MRWEHHSILDSTNSRALSLAVNANDAGNTAISQGSGFFEPVLVWADRQEKGRGRQGRTWHSAKGGAWFSLLWPMPLDAFATRSLPIVVGLAVSKAITSCLMEKGYTCRPQIKWPNDVLVDGKKLSGILCEQVFQGSQAKAVVIGIGINVNNDVNQEILRPLRREATSMKELAKGDRFDVKHVIEACVAELQSYLAQFETNGFAGTLQKEAEAILAWRNCEVELRYPNAFDSPAYAQNRVFARGVLRGLKPDGSLRLQRDSASLSDQSIDTASGELHYVSANSSTELDDHLNGHRKEKVDPALQKHGRHSLVHR